MGLVATARLPRTYVSSSTTTISILDNRRHASVPSLCCNLTATGPIEILRSHRRVASIGVRVHQRKSRLITNSKKVAKRMLCGRPTHHGVNIPSSGVMALKPENARQILLPRKSSLLRKPT